MVVYEILDSRQIKRHLLKKLAKEWGDDPSGPADLALIERCKWSTKVVGLKQIVLAEDAVGSQAFMRRLKRRAKAQMLLIQKRIPMPPLVVIGESHLLIDGYARYFALKKLSVREVVVYCGADKAISPSSKGHSSR